MGEEMMNGLVDDLMGEEEPDDPMGEEDVGPLADDPMGVEDVVEAADRLLDVLVVHITT
jgi:hypothetical protein